MDLQSLKILIDFVEIQEGIVPYLSEEVIYPCAFYFCTRKDNVKLQIRNTQNMYVRTLLHHVSFRDIANVYWNKSIYLHNISL